MWLIALSSTAGARAPPQDDNAARFGREMPEGDTIFRAARALNEALAGGVVRRFDTAYAQLARVNDDTPVVGRTVERVEARGKWLLIYFSGDLILVTHMLMSGSWHMYRVVNGKSERWRS